MNMHVLNVVRGAERELAPHHREQLRGSGLSDEVISAAGIYSLRDGSEAARILNWRRPIDKRCFMALPYYTLGGEIYNTVLRPDEPIHPRRKYEWPSGASKRPYFPPPSLLQQAAWGDPGYPIVVTEGIKKALVVAQVGFLAISFEGVETFHDVEVRHLTGMLQLHGDLLALPWRGRTVYIAYDNPDTLTKPNVIRAECRLAYLLDDVGAIVRLLRFPVAESEKRGLDDFLGAQSDPPSALDELLGNAVAPDIAVCRKHMGGGAKPSPPGNTPRACTRSSRVAAMSRRASVAATRRSGSPVPLPDGLPEDVVALVRHGHRVGAARHPQDLQVVLALLKAGCSDNEIADIFRGHPIGSKLREDGPSYLRLTISKARQWWEAERDADIREVRIGGEIYLDNVVPRAGYGPGKRVRIHGTYCDTGQGWTHVFSWPDAWRGTEEHVRALFASAGLTISDFSEPTAVFRLVNRTVHVAEFWPSECGSPQTRFLSPSAPAGASETSP